MPPLRERREDIPVLMNHFLQKFTRRHRRDVTGFTARAIDALLSYELPGNIRELENMIERGVILARPGGAIDGQPPVHGRRALGQPHLGFEPRWPRRHQRQAR